jgi:uncharacterized OB-fold protein
MAGFVPKPLPAVTLETARYWEGCKRHELLIQRCGACGQHQFYPRLYCSKCFSDRLEWTKASGCAAVTTFTIVRRPPSPAFADEVPYVVALVQLEEGPTMMTNIIGCAPESVAIGMPVVVTFEDWTEEISIPKFKPR